MFDHLTVLNFKPDPYSGYKILLDIWTCKRENFEEKGEKLNRVLLFGEHLTH